VQAGDVLVKYTYAGDSDLNGQMTFDDFSKFLDGYNGVQPPSWFYGDYDYNGVVDFTDFNTFINGYNLANGVNGATLSPAEQAQLASMATAAGAPLIVSNAAPAPEPGSLGVLAVAGVGMLARRRRKA